MRAGQQFEEEVGVLFIESTQALRPDPRLFLLNGGGNASFAGFEPLLILSQCDPASRLHQGSVAICGPCERYKPVVLKRDQPVPYVIDAVPGQAGDLHVRDESSRVFLGLIDRPEDR